MTTQPDTENQNIPCTPRAPFIIPVFVPHAGCPHQCIFCNQTAITATAPQAATLTSARETITSFLQYRRDPNQFTEIAFFGGNFLGIPRPLKADYLELAQEFIQDGTVQGIRFSTRPDTITREHINELAAYPVTTVELGAQSMDDSVLATACRGHRAADTQLAVTRLKRANYQIGLQMMVGLPGDTRSGVMASGRQLADLKPDFVRIYPTVVLQDSPLADWYHQGRYTPLDLDTAVDWVKSLYRLFTSHTIAVIRMGLPASAELGPQGALVAGPYHPAFGHMVLAALFFDRAARLLDAASTETWDEIVFRVHPRSASQLRGLANANLAKLQTSYQINQIQIIADATLPRNGLILESPRHATLHAHR